MATDNSSQPLGKQLSDYNRWRQGLIGKIQAFQDWLEQEGLAEAEDDLRVYELVEALKNDKLTIAIVGEFSRGKTELINAIFFADYKKRLLPTEAGRTTMCPTELRFDKDEPPCIKLLPIDTRRSPQTIAEYRRLTTYWTTFSLELGSPDQMAEALHEVVKSQTVGVREAQELGLHNEDTQENGSQTQIPVWRHAVINYPHPLLEQGLVILDTPGLNALGAEPELTMSMLPQAHVVMFVLGADTGVTKSDMAVWKDHVCMAKSDKNEGRIVVLNKIDTLWDELRGENAVSASISRQAQESAAALGVNKGHVFPVSAQKGLLGKIRKNEELVARSGLPELEVKLSEDIVPAKQVLIRKKVEHEMKDIVERTAATLGERLSATKAELKELKSISGKNRDVITNMMEKKRQDQESYDKKLANLEKTKHVLNEQVRLLLAKLSMNAFDGLIEKTREDMRGSWTTHGLKAGMRTFFDGSMVTMAKVHKQTERIKGLVEAVYKQFQVGHGLAKLKLESFALQPYYQQFKHLHKEAEVFRNSPTTVMTEQHFVVKKFFITLASRARQIFEESNKGAQLWSKAIMAPVFARIREHKLTMDQRVANLQKIHKSLDNLNVRISQLEAAREKLKQQQKITLSILPHVKQPTVSNGDDPGDNALAKPVSTEMDEDTTTITQPITTIEENEAITVTRSRITDDMQSSTAAARPSPVDDDEVPTDRLPVAGGAG